MGREKSKNNIFIYATICLLLVMLLLRNGFAMPISPTMILAVSVIPAFFASPSQMVAMVLGLLPMITGFQYKYALMLYMIVGFYRNKHLLYVSQLIFPVVFMLIWEFAHCIGEPFSMNEYLRSFSEILFVLFVTCMRWDKIDYAVIARSLSLSAIGIAIVLIYVQILQGNFTNILEILSQEEVRFGVRETEAEQFRLVFNPNELGFICNMAISSVLLLIVRREYTIVDVVLLSLCVLVGCFTLSRTFVVCLLFLILCFAFLSPGTKKQKITRISLLFILVVLLSWIIINYLPFILDAFIGRMEEKDISNGRVYLMEFYNQHIFSSFEYFFFGLGLQNFGKKISSLYGPYLNVSHNGIQEIWILWGVVGILLFIWFFSALIKESRKWSGERPFFAFLPLCCLLLNSMAGQFLTSGSSLYSIVLIFISMCMKWDNYQVRHAKK